MELLKDILTYDGLTEGSDMSELPEGTMKEIQSNIRKGAKDKNQNWSNALELCHKAYEVNGVERPEPSWRAAWKQYEENIQYAVQQLAHFHGLDGNWRMSSRSLREGYNDDYKRTFRVHVTGPNLKDTSFVVGAQNRNEVVRAVKQAFKESYDVKADMVDEGAEITFWKMGVRTNNKISIKPAKYQDDPEHTSAPHGP